MHQVGWCYTKQLGSSAEQRCNASLCSHRISQHLGLGGSYGTASGLAAPGHGLLGLGGLFPCPFVRLGLGFALLSCLACQLHDILQFCPQPCPLPCANLVRCELAFQQLVVGHEFVRSHGVAIYHHTHLGTRQTVAGHTPLFSSTLSQLPNVARIGRWHRHDAGSSAPCLCHAQFDHSQIWSDQANHHVRLPQPHTQLRGATPRNS
jgi:hypothetical protein